MDRDAASGSVSPAVTAVAVRVDSAELFNGHRHIVIVHAGQEYRLQITKTGKLILTK